MNSYTGIFEEKDVTFEEFVWRCARAFMPLFHMKEESFDSPIRCPDDQDWSSTYHKEGIEKATQRLAQYQKMTSAQIQDEINESHARMHQEAIDAIAKKHALKLRVDKVLNKTRAWNPPSSGHNALKEFMIKELEYLLEHECNTDYYDRQLAEPKRTVEAWLEDHIEWAERDIKYHTDHFNENAKGIDFARQWITELQDSVPTPAYQDKF